MDAENLATRLGYAPDAKLLIVNCDDLGSSRSANVGVYDALRGGLATSASLMVPCPWARDAAAMYRGEDVGVHLTLNAEWETYRWGPITHSPSLLDGDGGFPRTLEDAWDHADLEEVRTRAAGPRSSGRSSGGSTSAISTATWGRSSSAPSSSTCISSSPSTSHSPSGWVPAAVEQVVGLSVPRARLGRRRRVPRPLRALHRRRSPEARRARAVRPPARRHRDLPAPGRRHRRAARLTPRLARARRGSRLALPGSVVHRPRRPRRRRP